MAAEMCRLLHRGVCNHAMVVLEAYFDESGHPKDPTLKVFSIGGWIAPCGFWKRWELDWIHTLSSFGIHPKDFHMKDFAHSINAFSEWKGQEGQRRTFLRQLLHTFNPLFVPIGSSVLLEDYANLPERHKKTLGNPYQLCFNHVLLECISEASECAHGETVSIVFEQQPEFSGFAQKAWEDLRERHPDLYARVHGVTWTAQKDKFLPLLGADLLAYELREHIEELNYKTADQRRRRYPMQWILRWLTSAGGVFGKPQFDRLALKMDQAVEF